MRWGRSEGAGSSVVRASGQQAQSWRSRVGEQKPAGKPFEILKQEVRDAWLKVKANGGAPGADGQSIEDFESDLKSNLYKVWLCRVEDYAEWAAPGDRLACWWPWAALIGSA